MTARPVIAIDGMGGDHAPEVVVAGAIIARTRSPDIDFHFYGDEAKLWPLINASAELKAVSTVHHTSEMVAADAKPSQALRAGRQTSMRLAIDAVATGKADTVVSAGNTGALMAMAKVVLKMLPGIDRPAIATVFPTIRGESVMLDLGANIDCSPSNLVQFALMGAVFARTLLGLSVPTIGLLNIGAEELKGREEVRLAAAQLREMPLPGRFYGFVEGNDIARGTVDVVVTDGYTGNVALKTAEGTAQLYSEFLRQTFSSSLLAKLGFLLARRAFLHLKSRVDPRRYNGAMFLGLQAVCVKSHGGTDAFGFANAINVAADLVRHDFNGRIKAEVARLDKAAQSSMPEIIAL